MEKLPLPDKPLPDYYQYNTISRVYSTMLAGESCSMIGVGSVGKSNIMRHMLRWDVRMFHAKTIDPQKKLKDLILVYLDPHNMLHLQKMALEHVGELWIGYELMMSRLERVVRQIPDLQQSDTGKASVADRIRSAHNDMFNEHPVIAQRGFRHLENSLYRILRTNDNRKIAFLFDEIDEFKRLPPEFFLSLRGLRDDYKGRVMYVTTSRSDLDQVLMGHYDDRGKEIAEGFVELFYEHSIYIEPLDQASAQAAFERFVRRYQDDDRLNTTQANHLANELWQLTGGHVGLMRRSYKPTMDYYFYSKPHGVTLEQYLSGTSGVHKECQTIINSLTGEERQVLGEVLRTHKIPDPRVGDNLLKKHLIIRNQGVQCRYPLLENYIRQNPESLN